ncbi:MAG: hypothetical protein LC104_15625 [Bacteroidales bacterium]|nr:hypothetical protein [Bacteroidales bacterium]
MFSYHCPLCDEVLFAPEDESGRSTLCPICLKPIRIPPVPAAGEEPELLLQPVTVDPRPIPPASTIPPVLPTSPIVPAAPIPVDVRPMELPPTPPAPTASPPVSGTPRPPLEVLAAAQLASALRQQMNPPPTAPTDLKLSTASWMILTAAAVVLWAVAITTNPDGFRSVLLLAGLHLLIGWGMIVYWGSRGRNWLLPLLILPPVAAFRAAWPFPRVGRMPLAFVACGFLFAGMAQVGPPIRSALIPMIVNEEPHAQTDTDPEPHSDLVSHLLHERIRRDPEILIAELQELTEPEIRSTLNATERADLMATLQDLCRDAREDVRSTALQTLMVYQPTAAEEPLLLALRSDDPAERQFALMCAKACPTESVIVTVAGCFDNAVDRVLAKETLLQIGGPSVEKALLPLLHSDRQLVLMDVMELLEQLGGRDSVLALEQLAKTGPDLFVRTAAADTALRMQARLGTAASTINP